MQDVFKLGEKLALAEDEVKYLKRDLGPEVVRMLKDITAVEHTLYYTFKCNSEYTDAVVATLKEKIQWAFNDRCACRR